VGETSCQKHYIALNPYAAQLEEEKEYANSICKKLRLREMKKGLASSTKIDFMRLLNDLG
jgi:hypothetical protein